MNRAMKGGLGTCAFAKGDLQVGALAAVNCLGDVMDPETGDILAGLLDESGKSLLGTEPVMESLPAGSVNPLTGLPCGRYYEIPYRCLLPRQIEGLLVAGRCISGTHEAHGSYRVMATCMAMGQAAGTAAALASRAGCTPRQIDVQQLRETLRDNGVTL